jgi:hypothetical protein
LIRKHGIKTCNNGKWRECIGAIDPTNEICDKKDNDCDKQIDEGNVCIEPSWHTVITFTGSSSKKTQSFSIKGDQWRIKWNCQLNGEFETGNFIAWAEPTSGDYGELIANTSCPASEITYSYEGKRNYYLDIISTFVNWSLTVEDLY